VTITATLLGVSRVTISKVILAYMDHGKTSGKRNSRQKSTLTERDHRTLKRIVSKNDETTVAQVIAEMKIHHEDLESTKNARRELHKSSIHDRAAIIEPLTVESNAQMHKRWCHDHKTWTSDIWKRAHDVVR
jgi:hypothetical protein